MKEIILTRGKLALVDDEDYYKLIIYKWTALKAKNGRWYATRFDGLAYTYMHAEIMKTKYGEDVDHRNHDGLDNQRHNMRVCTRSQNHANRRKLTPASSKFKGVCYHKATNRWRAYIKKDYVQRYLGIYNTETDAALAYNEAAIKLFGEFALINDLS